MRTEGKLLGTHIRACILLAAVLLALPAPAAVRVWQDAVTLPTYEETLPDQNPPFRAFSPGHAVYPYTVRDGFSKHRSDHGWRALHVENEYLVCTVLPDLGGRLYSCKDKLSGQEMFYANPSVKKVPMGPRGAWVAMGLEMNFPTGPSWVAVSPVDFAALQNADGSASIWVGTTDRVSEMRWRVEFVLRPGAALLEQNVHIENPGAVRRRFSWWSEAAVLRVDDKTRFILPTHLVATPGVTELESWPVNEDGLDMSVAGNYKKGNVALFAHECREPFVAIYHPGSKSGVVHYADPGKVPGKMIWSFGAGREQAAIDMSDDRTSYVELQAGLFENQSTYQYLQPGESRSFTEYWIPVRGIGGVSRAGLDGVLNLARSADSAGRIQLAIEFEPSRKIAGAKIRILDGARPVLEESANLEPSANYTKTPKGLEASPRYTFELLDGAGKILLRHTEDQYDAAPSEGVELGRQTGLVSRNESKLAAPDFLRLGGQNELQGWPEGARARYTAGLNQFPDDPALHLALARLAAGDARYEEASDLLAKGPADAESHYYLGVAYAGLVQDDRARKELEAVPAGDGLHATAALALAELRARAKDLDGALQAIDRALGDRPALIRAGAIQIALLRRAGQTERARRQLAHFRALDPADPALRVEAARLGQDDAQLWPHLGADPERVLDVAIGYMNLGAYDDALALLDRRYPPPVDTMAAEPGMVLPQHYPLVAYYRAYCAARLGRDASKHLEAASGYLTEYVFPSRASSFPVLRYAVQQNPQDAAAFFLLGELYFATGQLDPALEAWQSARRLGYKRLELYRLLGRSLVEFKKDPRAAAEVYQQGLKLAPSDPEIVKGLQSLLSPRPTETAAAIPAPAATNGKTAAAPAPKTPLPESAEKLPDSRQGKAEYALVLAAEGRMQEAGAIFNAKNFPDEKQDESVRAAYIEVQVQGILQLARTRKCPEALAADERLGDENPALPFTFHGFGSIVKGLRVQYFRGEYFSVCGEDKEARKVWSRIEKLSREVTDPDFSLPLVAAAKLSAAARPRLQAALEQVKEAMKGASDRFTLVYSQGMLLRALGRESDAQAAFVEALDAKSPPLIRYLALSALRK